MYTRVYPQNMNWNSIEQLRKDYGQRRITMEEYEKVKYYVTNFMIDVGNSTENFPRCLKVCATKEGEIPKLVLIELQEKSPSKIYYKLINKVRI